MYSNNIYFFQEQAQTSNPIHTVANHKCLIPCIS